MLCLTASDWTSMHGLHAIAPQAFCFRETSPALHLGLQRFYNNSQFSDLTIVTPDGSKLHVHQVVLAAQSKRFSDVLNEGAVTSIAWPPCSLECMRHACIRAGSLQGEELPVRGVDAAGLDAVLRFFYSGECHLDYTNVIPVYDAAHRLDVPSLVTACEAFSNETLSPATVCTLLQQALQFLMHDYVEQCMALIRESFEEVTLEQDDFLTVSFQTLAGILSDAASHQPDEATVFRAAWRWGTAKLAHMQFLPEILQVVTIPSDLSVDELMKLSTSGKGGHEVAPAWPSLQQVPLQHILAGRDIVTAVRNVAQEAASMGESHLPSPMLGIRGGGGAVPGVPVLLPVQLATLHQAAAVHGVNGVPMIVETRMAAAGEARAGADELGRLQHGGGGGGEHKPHSFKSLAAGRGGGAAGRGYSEASGSGRERPGYLGPVSRGVCQV